MYKQALQVSSENHTIDVPSIFFGKKIEILIFEVDQKEEKIVKKNALKNLSGAFPDFPSIDEIRKNAWPDRW